MEESHLNRAQRAAVQATDGARLITECGVPPERISAMTFTNRAAREMQTRLRSLIGDSADEVSMGTFHSRLLRRYGDHIGVPSDFVIYDETDTKRSLRRILKEICERSPEPSELSAAADAISAAKNVGLSSERRAEGDMDPAHSAHTPSTRVRCGAPAPSTSTTCSREPCICSTNRPRRWRARRQIPARDDRRVSGHQRPAVPHLTRSRGHPRKHLRGRRPRPEHLQLEGLRYSELPKIQRGLSRSARDNPRDQPPFQRLHSQGRLGAHPPFRATERIREKGTERNQARWK